MEKITIKKGFVFIILKFEIYLNFDFSASAKATSAEALQFVFSGLSRLGRSRISAVEARKVRINETSITKEVDIEC